jgi:hypothetical protein
MRKHSFPTRRIILARLKSTRATGFSSNAQQPRDESRIPEDSFKSLYRDPAGPVKADIIPDKRFRRLSFELSPPQGNSLRRFKGRSTKGRGNAASLGSGFYPRTRNFSANYHGLFKAGKTRGADTCADTLLYAGVWCGSGGGGG